MAETVAREARCDFSDLLVDQCAHCRPPVEEPAPLDFIGIFENGVHGGPARTGRGNVGQRDIRQRQALYRGLIHNNGRAVDFNGDRLSLRHLGASPDTTIDDYREDVD